MKAVMKKRSAWVLGAALLLTAAAGLWQARAGQSGKAMACCQPHGKGCSDLRPIPTVRLGLCGVRISRGHAALHCGRPCERFITT